MKVQGLEELAKHKTVMMYDKARREYIWENFLKPLKKAKKLKSIKKRKASAYKEAKLLNEILGTYLKVKDRLEVYGNISTGLKQSEKEAELMKKVDKAFGLIEYQGHKQKEFYEKLIKRTEELASEYGVSEKEIILHDGDELFRRIYPTREEVEKVNSVVLEKLDKIKATVDPNDLIQDTKPARGIIGRYLAKRKQKKQDKIEEIKEVIAEEAVKFYETEFNRIYHD